MRSVVWYSKAYSGPNCITKTCKIYNIEGSSSRDCKTEAIQCTSTVETGTNIKQICLNQKISVSLIQSIKNIKYWRNYSTAIIEIDCDVWVANIIWINVFWNFIFYLCDANSNSWSEEMYFQQILVLVLHIQAMDGCWLFSTSIGVKKRGNTTNRVCYTNYITGESGSPGTFSRIKY